jgi:hypothetical protein
VDVRLVADAEFAEEQPVSLDWKPSVHMLMLLG